MKSAALAFAEYLVGAGNKFGMDQMTTVFTKNPARTGKKMYLRDLIMKLAAVVTARGLG
jgi:hypothetical protein